MNVLLRLLDFGIHVIDLLPRSRTSRFVAAVAALTFLLYPRLLQQVAELRAGPIIERVMDVAD